MRVNLICIYICFRQREKKRKKGDKKKSVRMKTCIYIYKCHTNSVATLKGDLGALSTLAIAIASGNTPNMAPNPINRPSFKSRPSLDTKLPKSVKFPSSSGVLNKPSSYNEVKARSICCKGGGSNTCYFKKKVHSMFFSLIF